METSPDSRPVEKKISKQKETLLREKNGATSGGEIIAVAQIDVNC